MNLRLLTEVYKFPDPWTIDEPIIAIGGDLHPFRLISAYQNGLFPWYNDDEPILWWCPLTRCILHLDDLKISKSMRQLFKKSLYQVTFDRDFESVILNCANIRSSNRTDTWLNEEMIKSYIQVHELGLAHSVEVWDDKGDLVGGLYGLSIGRCFFGESMFHKSSNASKYGFIALVQNLKQRGFQFIDCQIYNPHLGSLGAIEISKDEFRDLFMEHINSKTLQYKWSDWEFNQLEI